MNNKLDDLALDRLFREARTRKFPARGKDMQAYSSDPVAACARGPDCAPMSGFSNDGLDSEFFADTWIKSNFICSIGCGSNENLFPRNPRLTFDEAGRFA